MAELISKERARHEFALFFQDSKSLVEDCDSLLCMLPTIEAEPIVRCKDCVFYHKAHVKCNDGTEKDFSEFPSEAFGVLGYGVTGEYGINVGGKCEVDINCGYSDDKSVFRQPNDFCSQGKRRRDDNATD